MKRIRVNSNFLYGFVVICYIALFAHTGFSKLFALEQFTTNIGRQPFPGWLKTLIVPGLPVVELILATLMAFDKPRALALLGGTILMASFTVYAYMVVHRYFGFTPCGCGGIIEHLNWPEHLIFNSCFTLAGITGLLLHYIKRPGSQISGKQIQQLNT